MGLIDSKMILLKNHSISIGQNRKESMVVHGLTKAANYIILVIRKQISHSYELVLHIHTLNAVDITLYGKSFDY